MPTLKPRTLGGRERRWRRDTPRGPEWRWGPPAGAGTRWEGPGPGTLGRDPEGRSTGRWCNPGPQRTRRRLISSGLHHPGQRQSLAPGVHETLATEAAAASHASGCKRSRLELHRILSSVAAETVPVHQRCPGKSALGLRQDPAA